MNNQAFIDGQNLRLGTTLGDFGNPATAWKVDLRRFRIYLKEKYNVSKAYYFVGAYLPENLAMYEAIQGYGFQIIFREHSNDFASNKKGNVDTDIVFAIMRKLVVQEEFGKIILVSGDGDYWRMVDFLIGQDKFAKLLAPSPSRTSSLYRNRTPDTFVDYLNKPSIKKKIALKGWMPKAR